MTVHRITDSRITADSRSCYCEMLNCYFVHVSCLTAYFSLQLRLLTYCIIPRVLKLVVLHISNNFHLLTITNLTPHLASRLVDVYGRGREIRQFLSHLHTWCQSSSKEGCPVIGKYPVSWTTWSSLKIPPLGSTSMMSECPYSFADLPVLGRSLNDWQLSVMNECHNQIKYQHIQNVNKL